MIFVAVIFILYFVEAAICGYDIQYDVANKHGGNGGVDNKVICPMGGAFTGINYRSSDRLHQIGFVCTFPIGKTTLGPYGGGGGEPGSVHCPKGQYISSFSGRSNDRLVRLGIRCRPENDVDSRGVLVSEFGGTGGTEFDDLPFSIRSRPVAITVRAHGEVDAIQVTYGNDPIGTLCEDCTQYGEEWAPKHGGDGGDPRSFVCPTNGVITGIKYRSGDRLDSIEFICTSSLGETNVGPFGGNGGDPGEERCPPGSYISSIHGRSGGMVDKLGIQCTNFGQVVGGQKRDGHGGGGGSPFDDESFATNGKRPVEFRIRSGAKVDSIQIKYGNLPMASKCKVSRIEILDQNFIAVNDGIEVIGLSAASSCAPMLQQLNVQATRTVSETVEVETMEGRELEWSPEVSVAFTIGNNSETKSAVSVGLTQRFGGSNSWSYTEIKNTSTVTELSQVGTTVTYQGPGACLVFGFMNRYRIQRNNVPVLYHYSCEGGSLAPLFGTINFASTTFGSISFQDYQFRFYSEDYCTPEAKACVADMKSDRIIPGPWVLEADFKKCFVENSGWASRFGTDQESHEVNLSPETS